MSVNQFQFADEGPRPFFIRVHGTLNDSPIEIEGTGVVHRQGLYDATLNFSRIPEHFHPSAVATYIVSICCNQVAAMRNDGLNIQAMGAEGYETKRVLTFQPDLGQVTIQGNVSDTERGTVFEGTIEGQANLPDDLTGSSVYVKRIEPHEDGARLLSIGEGSLFRDRHQEVTVKIESEHRLRPTPLANPLTQIQYRMVSEAGHLIGRTYHTRVHAIVDTKDPFEAARSAVFESFDVNT
jgi:hypothetical protein